MQLAERNARHRANTDGVCFQISEVAAVTHVGLFDLDGELRFYGRLLSTRERDVPATEFEFRPYALNIVRLRPQDIRQRRPHS